MAGEAEAAKAAADAAATIVNAEPVLGSLLILALVGIMGLAWYVRSVHHSWGQERERWQQQLLDIQEKRISEGRASLSAISDLHAILTRHVETWQDMERSMGSIGSVLQAFATDERMAAASNSEAGRRIEAAVDKALNKIDALSSKIDRPLIETPSGLRRATGDVA